MENVTYVALYLRVPLSRRYVVCDLPPINYRLARFPSCVSQYESGELSTLCPHTF